jgi:hypothetical protein
MKGSIVSTSILLEPGWILILWEYFDGEGKSPRSLFHVLPILYILFAIPFGKFNSAILFVT